MLLSHLVGNKTYYDTRQFTMLHKAQNFQRALVYIFSVLAIWVALRSCRYYLHQSETAFSAVQRKFICYKNAAYLNARNFVLS